MPDHKNTQLNGVTLHEDGTSTFISLTDTNNSYLVELLRTLKHPRRLLSESEQRECAARQAEDEERADIFSEILDTADISIVEIRRIAQLDKREIAHLLSFVDLMEFGHHGLNNGNWILALIENLLWEVSYLGPSAAVQQGPADALLSFAEVYASFSDWIKNGQQMLEAYPDLFQPAGQTVDTPSVQGSLLQLLKTVGKGSVAGRQACGHGHTKVGR